MKGQGPLPLEPVVIFLGTAIPRTPSYRPAWLAPSHTEEAALGLLGN